MTLESIDSLLFDYTDGLDEGAFWEEEPSPSEASDGDADAKAGGPLEPICEAPASERIVALMASLAPQREVMLSILRACERPTPVAEVNEVAAALQIHNASVFSPADLCRLLQDAGALARVDEAGAPLDDATVEAEVVEEDGEAYLVPGTPVEAFWVATEDGLAAARADDPAGRLGALLAEDEEKALVFRRLLEVLDERGAATTPELGEAISAVELPRRSGLHVTHFLDRLERAGAVTWDGAWRPTAVGRMILQDDDSQEGGR